VGVLHEKLKILAESARYDASCASTRSPRDPVAAPGICHSYTPDGRCISLLKVLFTNYCIYDCAFCVNRVSNDIPRARFSVEEIVGLTVEFYRRNYVDGLFLSSGIVQSVDHTMEQLIEVARTLRMAHAFAGYIHLKVMPGASADLLKLAGRYADRVSANIELPTEADMRRLAPDKTHEAVERSMAAIQEEIAARQEDDSSAPEAFAPAGQTTQVIVGASATPDRDILATADRLYRRHRLRRVYYTAYSPIPGQESLFVQTPTALAREHRLYQGDRLLTEYGFDVDELFEAGPELDLRVDPKLAWALRHPEFFPVDVNTGSREQLLRVPGFGRRSVTRILRARRHARLGWSELRRLGARTAVSRYFVAAAGLRGWRRHDRVTADHLLPRASAQQPLPFPALP
jgi:putative DNA modification/repair radical SAM protein